MSIPLKDRFAGTEINLTKWGTFYGTDRPSIDKERLRLYNRQNDTNYTGMGSLVTYNFTDNEAFIECIYAGEQSLVSIETYPLDLTLDAANRLIWIIANGNLVAIRRVAGSNTTLYSVAYNSTTHRWFKIRETAGTVYWETSADGETWTVRASAATPFAVTALQVNILMGTYANEATPTYALFDNFNVEPIAATAAVVANQSTAGSIDVTELTGIYQVSRTDGGSVGAVGSIAANAQLHQAGNLLVAFISRQNTNAITVTDTAGNTWQQLGTDFMEAGNTNVLSIWYAYDITGHAANVVTAALTSGTGGYFIIAVREFAGFGASDPAGDFDSAHGASTTPSTPALTVTGAQALIFAGIEADGQSITAGSGYTGGEVSGIGFFFDEYKVVTAGEAPSANAATGDWRMVAGVFNASTTTPENTVVPSDYAILTEAADVVPSDYAVRTEVVYSLGSDYAIKVEALNTVPTDYAVKSEVADVVPADYAVLTEQLDTLSSSYNVLTEVFIPVAADYAVLTEALETVPTDYAVKSVASIAVDVTYRVTSEQSIVLTAEYEVIVTTQEANVVPADYAIKTEALSTIATDYAVKTEAVDSVGTTYGVLTEVYTPIPSDYAVASGALTELPTNYAVVSSNLVANPAEYAVLTAEGIVLPAAYDIFALVVPVLTTLPASYRIWSIERGETEVYAPTAPVYENAAEPYTPAGDKYPSTPTPYTPSGQVY